MPSNTQPTSIVDVRAAGERAADVDAIGVGERHARVEQRVGLRALVAPLEVRQLAHRVDAERFDHVRRHATSRSARLPCAPCAMTSVR